MNPQDAIDLSREAIMTCMMVGGPILAVGLLIGISVGVFQAMTQVQDQTVSFVPKILLLLAMIGLCLPWLTDKMLGFAKQSFETPMTHWDGAGQVANSQDETPVVNANAPDLIASYSGPPAIKAHPASFSKPITNGPSTGRLSATSLPQTNQTIASNKDPFTPDYSPPPFKLPNAQFAPETTTNKEPSANPFILPHYRISKNPKTDIGG